MATTPASVDRHPLHAILVAFPIGLWMFSLVCDLVWRFASRDAVWHLMAWYALVAGVIGALVAAVPGLIDFFSITDPQAGKVGMAHLILKWLWLFSTRSMPGCGRSSGRTPCFPFCSRWLGWRGW